MRGGEMARVADDDLQQLLEQTYSGSARERADAVRALCPCHVKRNEPRVWDRMIELAADADTKVRSQVLHVLADGSPHVRQPQVVAALEHLAGDSDESLRRRARKVLAAYHRSGKVNVL